MPPKGRKSLNNMWCTCEACGVVLSHKDVEHHSRSSCPPPTLTSDWEHAFIKDNVVYSFIDSSEVNDGPNIKVEEKSFLVYLSQSAMQLCKFEIGEQVLLTVNNDSLIRTVWPTLEKTLTSVILPSEFGVNHIFKEGSKIKVEKMTLKPLPASRILLSTPSEVPENNREQLLTLSKQLYTGKIVYCRSEICIPFYGKSVYALIKNITSTNDCAENNLEYQFNKLNIDNKIPNKQIYFIVVESTKWDVLLNKDDQNSNVSKEINLNQVGGYKEIIEDLMKTVSLSLKRNNDTPHISSSLGILLHGPSGVGKTIITQAIANEINVPVIKINSGELFSKFYGETELRLCSLFDKAKELGPSIITLDNVDTLCPRRGGSEQERRVMSYLLTLLDSLQGSRVVVLATTAQLSHVAPSLRRPGRLDCEVELPVPSVVDRQDILRILTKAWAIDDVELQNVAAVAHGHVAADLQSVVSHAATRAAAWGRMVTAEDLSWALSQVKPSAMREVLVQVPNVKWTDIGGMDDLKLKLQQAIEWPLKHPGAFTRLGICPPRGVLMYGPPGCSKTMIAKALATESKLNFLSIKGSELFSKWVGESEKAVQSLFRKARAVAPSIVFLDELDALGGERSGAGEGSNVQERVLAQLLTEMDGVEPLGNVNIVAATNRPDRIDKALLRPGRLDRMIYVPLPDLATRICILQLQLVKMPVSDVVVIDDLAMKTEGYSGAEVISVCHEAAINALQEDLNVNEVCARHFHAALNMVKPRTPSSLLKLYDTYSRL